MNRTRILRIGAIVAVAGATGLVMQGQEAARAPASQAAAMVPATTPQPAPDPLPVRQTEASPPRIAATVPASLAPAALAPAATPADGPQPVALTAAPPTQDPVLADSAATCSEALAVIARPGAMLDLGLIAPCRPGQRIVVRHGDLVFSGQTSPAGTFVASVPAFEATGKVTVTFADGTTMSEAAPVADLTGVERFAVQWMADDSFALHAMHAGSGYGQAGHIHAGAPGNAQGQGGFLTTLGQPGTERALLAEVFTWPAGTPATAKDIALSIEAAVTEATCDRELLGETLQHTGGRTLVRDLTMAMPDCSAVGEFVALPDPLVPERLAAR